MGSAGRGEQFVNCQKGTIKKKKEGLEKKKAQSVNNLIAFLEGTAGKRELKGEKKKKGAGRWEKEGRKGKEEETYWPFLFGWCSKRTEDGLELIHVTLSREVWYSKHQLRKYASDGPDINRGTVVAATE